MVMVNWPKPALDYISRWIEFQIRQREQPACVIVISHKGRIVLEEAFGHADIIRGIPFTPRHCFRAASHSKSFTAAGILKLCEKDKLRLDDRVGRFVDDLHPAVEQVTIAQLLSHSAGIVRDGPDDGQFLDRRPFLIFMDADSDQWPLAREIGADRVELYTQPYAEAFASGDVETVWATYAAAAKAAQAVGLGVNAGHDLNLQNLGRFCEIPGILEVSIGHALVADALEMGFSSAVRAYLRILAADASPEAA